MPVALLKSVWSSLVSLQKVTWNEDSAALMYQIKVTHNTKKNLI